MDTAISFWVFLAVLWMVATGRVEAIIKVAKSPPPSTMAPVPEDNTP